MQHSWSRRRQAEPETAVPDDGRATARPRRLLSLRRVKLPPRNRLLAFGGLGLAVIVVAAAVLVPLAMPRSADESSPSPIAQVSEQSTGTILQTPTPTAAASGTPDTPTATTRTAPDPALAYLDFNPGPEANGWPIVWKARRPFNLDPLPSGDIYLSYFSRDYPKHNWAIDVNGAGKSKPSFLVGRDGEPLAYVATGADGTVYAVSPDHWADESRLVYAFSPDGQAIAGWPVKLHRWIDVLGPGPNGTLYVYDRDYDYGELKILSHDGRVVGVSEGARHRIDLADPHWVVIRPDGSIVSLCWYCEPNVVSVFDPQANLVASAEADWHHLVSGADGTVVAVEWGTAGGWTIAILGSDGRPRPGWPVTIEDNASEPTVGPDGTVYVTLQGTGSTPSKLTALGPDGRSKPGWPFTLPAGYRAVGDGCDDPVRPIDAAVSSSGIVFLIAEKNDTQVMYALRPDGKVLPGWPATLPAGIAPMFYGIGEGDIACDVVSLVSPTLVDLPDGSTRVYIPTYSSILAYAENGKPVPGWPLPGGYGDFWLMPDRGLVTLSANYDHNNDPDPFVTITLRRWLSDGTLAPSGPSSSPAPQASPSPEPTGSTAPSPGPTEPP